MTEFYTWTWPARLLVTLLLALCVLAQALAVVLGWYSRKRLRTLPELFLLALVLAGSMLYGQVLNSFDIGLVAPVRYDVPAWSFLAVLAILLARGIVISLRRYREIKTSISALSIKNAIDSLRTGVLFCEPDGHILLANAQMQRLMMTITSKVYRNGSAFWALLEAEPLRILPDGAAWKFTRTELHIKRKKYIQLTAADITERWELTAQLQQQNEQLQQRGEELKNTIANLHTLSRERETQKAKMRAHDILGHRMTLLLRTVRNEQALDYDSLRALSQSLLEELKRRAPEQRDFLESLRREFTRVGVEIRLEGILPENPLFAEIIREGVTNAVRHGFATQVFVHIEASRLRITDNGAAPPDQITEGGGLGNIREQAEACGGALRVTAQPHLALEIILPGGGECDV